MTKIIDRCDGNVPVPIRWRRATQREKLAVLVHQLTLLHRLAIGRDLRVGIKPTLQVV